MRIGFVLWLFLSTRAGAADTDAGRATYVAKCQACHGTTGKGDGPAARALPKPPRSFAAAEFWTGMTDDRLGVAIANGKPGSAMRGFPMDDAQRADLIAYLKSFQPAP
jgi:high-affinity iron transporter